MLERLTEIAEVKTQKLGGIHSMHFNAICLNVMFAVFLVSWCVSSQEEKKKSIASVERPSDLP